MEMSNLKINGKFYIKENSFYEGRKEIFTIETPEIEFSFDSKDEAKSFLKKVINHCCLLAKEMPKTEVFFKHYLEIKTERIKRNVYSPESDDGRIGGSWDSEYSTIKKIVHYTKEEKKITQCDFEYDDYYREYRFNHAERNPHETEIKETVIAEISGAKDKGFLEIMEAKRNYKLMFSSGVLIISEDLSEDAYDILRKLKINYNHQ